MKRKKERLELLIAVREDYRERLANGELDKSGIQLLYRLSDYIEEVQSVNGEPDWSVAREILKQMVGPAIKALWEVIKGPSG